MEVTLGIDVGTSGMRAVAVSLTGEVIAVAHCDFPSDATCHDMGRVEQDPAVWSPSLWNVLREISSTLKKLSPLPKIVGIAVDATSGTFLLLDRNFIPMTPAILYNDLRGAQFCQEAQQALGAVLQPYGITIAPAFALCKLLFLREHQPQLLEQCRRIVHQTDYIVGLLTGNFDVTDVSSALKTGVNPATLEWPAEIERKLGLPTDRLPQVRLSGEVIGRVTEEAAKRSGLAPGIPVVSGCTDGTAAAIASGIRASGDLNVTLGTTLVFKAVSASPLHDPEGRVYNHRHPDGGYLPGAASSAGAGWVKELASHADLQQLESEATACIPTGLCVYPLPTEGERFPFSCPRAKGFGLSDIADLPRRFAAGMEGIAYLERMGIEVLEALGLPHSQVTYATGGATRNELWLRIRAAITGRVMLLTENPESAFGAAILAAVPRFGSCRAAQEKMVRIHKRIEPEQRLTLDYEQGYEGFCRELENLGYIIQGC